MFRSGSVKKATTFSAACRSNSRRPVSFAHSRATVGVTCIKPTFGRISLHGVIPLTYTRDHVGSMARNAMDAAILLQVLAQPDPNDPRTLGLPEPPDYVLAATPVGGERPRLRWDTRVGLWPGFLSTDNQAELALRQALVARLEELGADIVPEVTRVVLLKQGRVVGDGPPEALLTSATLSALFERDVEVTRGDGHYHAW